MSDMNGGGRRFRSDDELEQRQKPAERPQDNRMPYIEQISPPITPSTGSQSRASGRRYKEDDSTPQRGKEPLKLANDPEEIRSRSSSAQGSRASSNGYQPRRQASRPNNASGNTEFIGEIRSDSGSNRASRGFIDQYDLDKRSDAAPRRSEEASREPRRAPSEDYQQNAYSSSRQGAARPNSSAPQRGASYSADQRSPQRSAQSRAPQQKQTQRPPASQRPVDERRPRREDYDDERYGYDEDLGRVERQAGYRSGAQGRKIPILPIALVIVLIVGLVIVANATGLIGGNKEEKKDDGLVNVSGLDLEVATPTPEVTPTPEPTPPPLNTKYASLYPDLQVEKVNVKQAEDGDKIVYLTFDDGPASSQSRLLDALDKYDVKATFFMSAQFYDDDAIIAQLKDAHDRGHSVAVHTYSHDYDDIYSSVEAYLDDFNKMNELIKKATGETNPVFRFPGGSDTGWNASIRQELFEEMNGRGFVYYDWDVLNGDSEGYDFYGQIDMVLGGVPYYDQCIVLMHNTPDKDATIETLDSILPALIEKGYRFEVLDASVPTTQYASVDNLKLD